MIDIIAVPNGAFSLQDFLDLPTSSEIVESLKDKPFTKSMKTKVFLKIYQTFDLVAQFEQQGFETSTINPLEVAGIAHEAIEQAWEVILETFSDEDRALLNSLFEEPALQH
jgi:hypothetical protein